MSGSVYCITNDDINFKIGKTGRSAQERAKEIGESTICEPFRVIFFIKVNDMSTVEKEAHQLLKEYRVRKDREFFKTELSVIKAVFDNLSNKYPCKELVELEDIRFKYHKNRLTLKASLECPEYVLFKRRMSHFDCLIDLAREGKVTSVSKMCYDFWNELPASQEPVDPDFLKSLELLEIQP
jgi:uncharacterized protein YqfB (UPF0267 family)